MQLYKYSEIMGLIMDVSAHVHFSEKECKVFTGFTEGVVPQNIKNYETEKY